MKKKSTPNSIATKNYLRNTIKNVTKVRSEINSFIKRTEVGIKFCALEYIDNPKDADEYTYNLFLNEYENDLVLESLIYDEALWVIDHVLSKLCEELTFVIEMEKENVYEINRRLDVLSDFIREVSIVPWLLKAFTDRATHLVDIDLP